MKKTPFLYVTFGFIVGIFYIAACGGAGSAIADAVDQLFDNSPSGLTAENVQAAIDEVEARVDTLEGQNLSTLLVGLWSGSEYSENGTIESLSITFAGDGTYTCVGNSSSPSLRSSDVCSSPVSWNAFKKTIRLVFNSTSSSSSGSSSSSSSSSLTRQVTTQKQVILPVNFIDADDLEITTHSEDIGMAVLILAKSS